MKYCNVNNNKNTHVNFFYIYIWENNIKMANKCKQKQKGQINLFF